MVYNLKMFVLFMSSNRNLDRVHDRIYIYMYRNNTPINCVRAETFDIYKMVLYFVINKRWSLFLMIM